MATSSNQLPDNLPQGGRLLGRPSVQQFIKYSLVGASSFAVDYAVSSFLFYSLHFSISMASAVSFLFGVTNGFFWNSRWTFKHIEATAPHTRYAKFLAVNLVGLAINLICVNAILLLLNGSAHHDTTSKISFLIAKLGACSVVVFWNFFANKHWTFKA